MRLFIGIFFLIICNFAFAQSVRMYINEGDRQFEEGNYYGAVWMFKKAISSDANNEAIIYRYAEACRLNNDLAEAEKYYLKVMEENKNRFPLALFWLADVQKGLGQYQKARKNFSEYSKLHILENDFFAKKAKHEILACEKAIDLKFSPKNILIAHLDTTVNTVNGEFGTSVIADSIMFYSSLVPVKSGEDTNQYCAKIFVSKIERDTIYKSGILLDTLINSIGFNVTNPSFSRSTQTLYFSKAPLNPMNGKSKIFRSKLSNGKWLLPECLPNIINVPNKISTQPSVTKMKSGEILLFVSDRNGGSGKLDIWYAPIQKNGLFTKVLNLGVPINIDTSLVYMLDTKSKLNTIDDEIAPFYDPVDSILYFSSRWHEGLGGFDVFMTKGDFIKWQNPENIGYPLNSSWNDVFFNMDSKAKHVYFTSNRKGSLSKKKETCCNDIWSYHLPKKNVTDSILVKKQKAEDEQRLTKVFEKEIKLLVPLTLYFDNDYPDPRTNDTVTRVGYELLYEQYISKEADFRTKYTKGLSLSKVGVAIEDIDNFFYGQVQKGYDQLLYFTLFMEKLLLKNQEIIMTLKGYCSPLNTFDYNKNLAKRRISSLVNYFMEYKNGILKKYLENNQLKIEQDPVGKLTNTNVSEDIMDLRNSVFSPAASLERKIQIIAIQVNK